MKTPKTSDPECQRRATSQLQDLVICSRRMMVDRCRCGVWVFNPRTRSVAWWCFHHSRWILDEEVITDHICDERPGGSNMTVSTHTDEFDI